MIPLRLGKKKTPGDPGAGGSLETPEPLETMSRGLAAHCRFFRQILAAPQAPFVERAAD